MKKKKFTVIIVAHGEISTVTITNKVSAVSISQAAVLAEQACADIQQAFSESLYVDSVTACK